MVRAAYTVRIIAIPSAFQSVLLFQGLIMSSDVFWELWYILFPISN